MNKELYSTPLHSHLEKTNLTKLISDFKLKLKIYVRLEFPRGGDERGERGYIPLPFRVYLNIYIFLVLINT